MSIKSVGEVAESLHSAVANGVAQTDSPSPLPPATPAHIIRTDEEAIAIAHRLAERFV